MRPSIWKFYWVLLKLYLLTLLFVPFLDRALALNENFQLYNAPQALAMGNAFTADAYGYLANYYNPAGLAKAFKKSWEVVLFDLEQVSSLRGYSNAWAAQSFGLYRMFGALKKNPNQYTFFSFAGVPAVSTRGVAFSFLGSYRYAAQADGSNIDIDSAVDVGPSIGIARNFAGNLVKLGVTARFLVRSQLKGNFPYSAFDGGDNAIAAIGKEGFGIGGDIGTLITFPSKYLPTIGLVWKDVLGTHFMRAKILNSRASGVPDKIEQTVNTAFSVHPYLSRIWRGAIAFEIKHIERVDLPLRKRAHFGVQIENQKSLYFWVGLNQLYPTAGLALRLRGGNLEIGTYGEDIGAGSATKEDRRFFFRYTISF